MFHVTHTRPTNEQLVRENLKTRGIEACEQLEEAIASPVGIAGSMDYAVSNLVFIADAYAQLYSDPREHDPNVVGNKWVKASLSFVEKGARVGKISKNMAKLVLLRPTMHQEQIEDWQDIRREVFWQNPGYHGPRYGREYAQAVAYGKVTLRPHADFN